MAPLDYSSVLSSESVVRRWLRRYRVRLGVVCTLVVVIGVAVWCGPRIAHRYELHRLQRDCLVYTTARDVPIWVAGAEGPEHGRVLQRCAQWNDLLAASGQPSRPGTFLVGCLVGHDGV